MYNLQTVCRLKRQHKTSHHTGGLGVGGLVCVRVHLLLQTAGQLVAQVVAVVVLQLMCNDIKLTPQLKHKRIHLILFEIKWQQENQ